MRVYDKAGKPIDLPDEQAAAGIASGEYGVERGTRVPVTEGGRLGSVPAENLATDLQKGAKLASSEQVQHARDEAKYGGVLGQLAAGVGGAASGASLGITDELAAALGPEGTREYLEGAYRTNPNLTTAAKIGGALAPAAFGEEGSILGALGEAGEAAEGASALGRAGDVAGAVGKAISAPSRAVSAVGRGIEGAVSRALGAGEEGSLISRLAKGAAAKGAGFATEGAAYGLADQVNEDVLGDHELNAEKLYASGVHGALLGLAGGVGLSAAGELGSSLLGRLTPKLGGMAEEQAVRAIEPHAAGARELERLPGGAKAAGRQMLEDGIIRPGDTLEDITPRIAKARDAAGAEVGGIYKAADEAGLEGVSVQGLTDRIQSKIDELSKLDILNEQPIAALKRGLAQIHKVAGVAAEGVGTAEERATQIEHAMLPFQAAQEFKTNLGKAINWKRSPFPGVEDKANEAMKDVYKAVSEEIGSAADRAAKDLGGSFREELADANRRYQTYATLDRIAQNSSRLAEGRNIVSPSSKGAGMAALAGMLAHGAGGPASLATAAAAAGANHLIKTRGASTAAVLLDKLSALRGVERATNRVDREIDRGIAGILREPGRAEPTLRDYEQGPYRTHAEAALSAAKNLKAHRASLGEAAAPLAQHAPNTARAFQSVGARVAQYLAGVVPHRNQPPSITPHLDEPRVSKADEQDYMLRDRAAHDPVFVLDELAKGRATKGMVEAFREGFPKMYAEVVRKLQERLADRTDPLPYESRKQLALLFGPMAGPEFQPAFVQRMQGDFAVPAGPTAPPSPKRGGSAPKRKLDTADALKLAGS